MTKVPFAKDGEMQLKAQNKLVSEALSLNYFITHALPKFKRSKLRYAATDMNEYILMTAGIVLCSTLQQLNVRSSVAQVM